jgi:hypothetical protein
VRVTDANSGTVIELAASAVVSIREYPAGQCQVSTTDPSFPVIQASESVEDLERARREELAR